MRSVAEDLYARALDSALDDVLRVLPPPGAPADLRMAPAPALVRAPASPGASSALLRAVLSDEDNAAP